MFCYPVMLERDTGLGLEEPSVPYSIDLFLHLEKQEAITEFEQKNDLIRFEFQKGNSAI